MAFKRSEDPEVIEQALLVPDEEVQIVWRAWLTAHGSSGRGKPPKLSENRYDTIRVGIIRYGLKDCIKAVYGILHSDWHMGNNPGTKVYNSLELIFRDAWRVKKFVRMFEENKESFQDVVFTVGTRLQTGNDVGSIPSTSTVAEE